jgi:hypothetical protein
MRTVTIALIAVDGVILAHTDPAATRLRATERDPDATLN